MRRIGIALDLGTSGFRGQAMELDKRPGILSTAVTTRHPLPGANVMDHLHCVIELGLDWGQEVVVQAVNKVIRHLRIKKDDVVRLAVCGNPIQLSVFQGTEIRDLAYAGKRKLEALGVTPPKRDARIVKARDIQGLDLPQDTEILIPPAVRHEIGADALAMMIQTGMLEKDEIAIATDYGTNAEMALIHKGTVYTGSTAAGPALEGQQIEDGLLALPGAISDVAVLKTDPDGPNPSDSPSAGSALRLETWILDPDMTARTGNVVDPGTGALLDRGRLEALGITGTGVIALISEGLKAGLIKIPKIQTPDGKIHLPNGIRFTQKDLVEAGKAIGAIRAGHITLCQEAGISSADVETAYMSGASGTYVDALKAQRIGVVPPGVKRIYQVGNTSLAMARDLVVNPDGLWRMKEIADHLRQHHCMFASSQTFERVYILELSYWTDGMSMEHYQNFLKKFKLPQVKTVTHKPEVIKAEERDIADPGVHGLRIIPDIGERRTTVFQGCVGDSSCVSECPEHALTMEEQGAEFRIIQDLALCNGVACRRCEESCGEHCFDWTKLITSTSSV